MIKKDTYNHILSFMIVTIISILFLFFAIKIVDYSPGVSSDGQVYDAEVIEVIETIDTEIYEGVVNSEIIFKAKITSGNFKNEEFEMTQSISEMFFPTPPKVDVGDNILVSQYNQTGENIIESGWFYMGHNKISLIITLVSVFVVLTIIIGHFKGLYAVVALTLSMLSIFLVYIPSILSQHNIYLSTIVIVIFIILSNLTILNGFNNKTLCAIVGNLGGIIIAGVLAFVVNNVFNISGALDEDYLMLTMLPNNASIDLRGIVWGGVLIGSLGAVMDVSMSIASAMQEVAQEMQERNFKNLVRSGMNVGRDAIGTMTTTLILAYVGSTLAPIILFTAYNRNLLILMNFEVILVEIINGAVGSIGILLAVPATVGVGAWLFTKE